MDPIAWLVLHHVPAAPAPAPKQGGGASTHRQEQAVRIAALIRKLGRPVSRAEIREMLGMGRTVTRNACLAGEEMGLLKQALDGLSDCGVYTYWVDLA